ncbi:hypothetical protein EYF80_014643 [Liparis tanakae]|uniref:Uncharacterized protein n=1 Tax=Liparis tanakae TaxID=230148 RepID=A0A4Z2IB07_9TELE|nr:hypothetical protein EYF80_014643 [Liparis tanakae]
MIVIRAAGNSEPRRPPIGMLRGVIDDHHPAGFLHLSLVEAQDAVMVLGPGDVIGVGQHFGGDGAYGRNLVGRKQNYRKQNCFVFFMTKRSSVVPSVYLFQFVLFLPELSVKIHVADSPYLVHVKRRPMDSRLLIQADRASTALIRQDTVDQVAVSRDYSNSKSHRILNAVSVFCFERLTRDHKSQVTVLQNPQRWGSLVHQDLRHSIVHW